MRLFSFASDWWEPWCESSGPMNCQFCRDTIGCKTQVALLGCDRSVSTVSDGDVITAILLFCNKYEFRIGIIYINLAVGSNVTSPFGYYACVYDSII